MLSRGPSAFRLVAAHRLRSNGPVFTARAARRTCGTSLRCLLFCLPRSGKQHQAAHVPSQTSATSPPSALPFVLPKPEASILSTTPLHMTCGRGGQPCVLHNNGTETYEVDRRQKNRAASGLIDGSMTPTAVLYLSLVVGIIDGSAAASPVLWRDLRHVYLLLHRPKEIRPEDGDLRAGSEKMLVCSGSARYIHRHSK